MRGLKRETRMKVLMITVVMGGYLYILENVVSTGTHI